MSLIFLKSIPFLFDGCNMFSCLLMIDVDVLFFCNVSFLKVTLFETMLKTLLRFLVSLVLPS